MRGLVADTAYLEVVVGHVIDVFVESLFRHFHLLTVVLVEAAPNQQVEVEIAFAENNVAAHLSVVAHACLYLHTVDVSTLFGDEVHHSCEGHTAIKR